MTTIEELDRSLMGQFTVDSISGSGSTTVGLIPSDNFYIAQIQLQSFERAKQTKTLFQTEAFNGMPGVNPLQTMVMQYYKDKMAQLLISGEARTNQCMKYFYSIEDIDIICTQIAHLAEAAALKNIENIADASQEELNASLEPETVSISIAIYVYFTILVNQSFSADDYDRLFETAWYKYFKGWQSFTLMLRMAGSSWRGNFSGALMSD